MDFSSYMFNLILQSAFGILSFVFYETLYILKRIVKENTYLVRETHLIIAVICQSATDSSTRESGGHLQ